ncbi:MAG: hypothetical protein WD738_12385 [Pirellulales bacterium]
MFFHGRPAWGGPYSEEFAMVAFINASSTVGNKRRPLRRRRMAPSRQTPRWHDGFLRLLPDIIRQARIRLRHMDAHAREDALQEIIADTVVAYARLAALGKEGLAYPTPLVAYAIAKFHAGRRVGSRCNVRDITSEYCQRRKRVVVERLDRFNDRSGEWQEMLVEDRRATAADVVAIRIDFRDWLQTLRMRDRRIAETLAIGETTSRVARMFAISAGRVSQLRQKFRVSWYTFIGELAPDNVEGTRCA